MKYAVVLGDGMAGWRWRNWGAGRRWRRRPRLSWTGLPGRRRSAWHPWCRRRWRRAATRPICLSLDMTRGSTTRGAPLWRRSASAWIWQRTTCPFRCNLVTLSEEEERYEDRHMLDHSSDEISTEDAAILLADLKKALEREGYTFYAGTSYRHLLVWKKGQVTELVPPPRHPDKADRGVSSGRRAATGDDGEKLRYPFRPSPEPGEKEAGAPSGQFRLVLGRRHAAAPGLTSRKRRGCGAS